MGIMEKWNRAEIFGMSIDIANEDKIEYYPDLKNIPDKTWSSVSNST